MKIRQGFVSNSSSSSFACDVCGETVEGWDACLSEAEMSECINGHIFCNDHMKKKKEDPTIEELREFCLGNYSTRDKERREELLEMEYDEVMDEAESWDYGVDDEYNVPESRCPICSFKNVASDEAYKYLLGRLNMSEAQLLGELKGKFDSYAEMQKSIKGIK